MHETTPLLRFVEDQLQIAALTFMAVVYALKIRWILKFPAFRDRQARTGSAETSPSKAARHSLFAIFLPWEMASTRGRPFFYLQFGIFHMGVAVSIAMSFVIPYAPGLIASGAAVGTLQAVFAAAFVAGVLRIIRRISDPYVRSISTPDDHFSLALLTAWFALSFMAAPNRPADGEGWLMAYFIVTAFFLVYVPFSKISHYLYYPFARWYLGKTLGHRGVYPVRRTA